MEILIIDAKRNPQGLDADGLAGLIMSFKENHDASVIQEGNTLIMYHPNGEANAEFHCFNADTPPNLAANVVKFFEMAKKLGYRTATTPYNNPKVSELFKQFLPKKYKLEIKKKKGQFEAKVRL